MSADAPRPPENSGTLSAPDSPSAACSQKAPGSPQASEDAKAVAAFVALLEERHASIAARESEALAALDRDQEAYRQLMTQRAQLVAALDDNALLELAAALPQAMRDEAQGALRRFAGSARHGLGIGSVFYHSALLYPDDHQKGEPDNLRLLIQRLAKETA